ncbi:MAG TPA: helix-turn-helix transcriptional regulator [Streptosporangiaceae bacterium]|jgi:transcriptional regulator with XRE-family HTH domain|nr:helix-turn-helix transcriptional regulator [Streptosporangiaceae bacterium]
MSIDIDTAADVSADGGGLDYQQAGPIAVRLLVGAQLRQLREAAGITREQAGDAIRASHSKISRLELGRTGFKPRDVADLLTLYGVTDTAERTSLLSLAEQANSPGWWRPYADLVPPWFEAYLGLEQAAAVIRGYEVQFVPGLLQTPDYARAVIRLGHTTESKADIDRRVALRMERQEILRRPDAPSLWVVIDEGALRRPLGGAATMRRQLDHLREVAELPNVTVQLLPFSVGGHPAAGGPITILRFPEGELPDVVYLEQLISAIYLDKPSETFEYGHVMNRLAVEAETPARTKRLIQRLREEL